MSKLHGNAFPEKKRIEVATAHCMGLKVPAIAAATGVKIDTIRSWKMTDWFKELVAEIQREDDSEVDAKLTKIVGKSLDTLVDRLENGDFMYDVKEGKFVRKPLTTIAVTKVADIMFDKRNLLRGKPTSISAKEQVSDRLLKLAEEFQRFVNAKVVTAEVIYEDAIQERSTETVSLEEQPGDSQEMDQGIPQSTGEITSPFRPETGL